MTNVAMLQTAADLSASITAQGISSLVPAGVILAFGGATAPTGWLLCNGAAISRVTYADLFAAIGIAHGYGDNVPVTGTFNLPDYRGRFIRGTDTMGTAASRDPNKATRTVANTGGNTGDAVGSVQGDVMQGHYHSKSETNHTHIQDAHSHGISDPGQSYGVSNNATAAGSTGFYGRFGNGVWGVANSTATNQGASSNVAITAASTDGTNGAPRTSSETRPLNAYVNYIIKI